MKKATVMLEAPQMELLKAGKSVVVRLPDAEVEIKLGPKVQLRFTAERFRNSMPRSPFDGIFGI